MKVIAAVAFATLISGTSAHAATTQFVVDGQFESTYDGADAQSLADWTATGLARVFTNADNPSGLGMWTNTTSGNGWNGLSSTGVGNFVALDGAFPTTSDNASISQLITGLTVGRHYKLTFDYGFSQERDPSGVYFSGDTINSLTASFGSTDWNSGNILLTSHGFVGWDSATIDFTATSGSELLKFVARANVALPSYALLSNVSISSAVPEPATWAMMILGFFGVGATARRRQRALMAA